MDQLIRSVTRKFTKLLPADTPSFTPDDLREFDIPEFVVQRIEVEIYRNLNESIVPPHSEWADMSAESVEYAWDQFIEAIVAEVRMPASFAASVFETSVADVIEIILHPRSAIPSILFGPETSLTKAELIKRRRFITVNTHLADAVLKYMDRKGKESIDLSVSKKIVERVDDRLTENYNSLNWAQLLHPLFILAGPKVDSELFRIFFEDRGMNRISRRFDLMNESLDKTGFIEVLSSPDLLNEEGYEEEQASLFDSFVSSSEPVKESETTDTADPEDEPAEAQISISRDDSAKDEIRPDKRSVPQEKVDTEDEAPADIRAHAVPDEDESDVEEEEDTLLSSFRSKLRPDAAAEQKESEQDEEEFVYSRFSEDIEEADEEEYVYKDRVDVEEEIDESGPEPLPERSPIADLQEPKDELKKSEEVDVDDTGEEQDSDEYRPNFDEYSESDDDSRPIWQSFLGDEDHIEEDDIEDPKYSPYAGIEDEDDEEPLIDLTKTEDEEMTASELIGWMESDENRFTESIFSGSEAAYEQALVKLDSFDNWKQASGYIEKEIFARNFVDMYDEDAVDFTDRMQAYFDQFKS